MHKTLLAFAALLAVTVAGVSFAEEETYDDLFTFRCTKDYSGIAEKWAAAYMKKVKKIEAKAEVIDESEFKDKIDNEMLAIGPMLPQRDVDKLESSVSPAVHIEIFKDGSRSIFAWGDEIMINNSTSGTSSNKLLKEALDLILSSIGQTIAKDAGCTPLTLKNLNETRKKWKLKELTKTEYKF
ncbi:MAG: hypothetical protein AABZ39_02125 [Spirochaetota bacterium]